jgi:hypothetical protein
MSARESDATKQKRAKTFVALLGLEHKHQPLASPAEFNRRIMHVTGATFAVLAAWLAVGVLGYRVLAHQSLVDAIYNASMIMGGMGPVDVLPDATSKLFASAYAILSGVLLLAAVGVMLSPVLHRILHRFHVGDEG